MVFRPLHHIKNFKKRYLIPALAALSVLIPSSTAKSYEAGSYENPNAHPTITLQALNLYNSSVESEERIPDSDIENIVRGSIEEDSCPRYLNHFRDIKTGKGIWGFPSSLEWATSSSAQLSEVFPAERVSQPARGVYEKILENVCCHVENSCCDCEFYPQGDQSLEKAVQDIKDGQFSQSVGHILHLVEDMTVPAHVRNDVHILKAVGLGINSEGISFSRIGDGFEAYLAFNLEKLNSIQPQQIREFNSLGELFRDASKFSGEHFFSDDSIEDGKHPLPSVCSLETKREGARFYLVNNIDGKEVHVLRKSLFGALTDTCRGDGYLIDDTCLKDYVEVLAPRAVEYAAGALKLLAKERCFDRDGDHFFTKESCGTEVDCDDQNNYVNPGQTEICDGLDNDCDGETDEYLLNYFYPDLDGDGFGTSHNYQSERVRVQACQAPAGYVDNHTDCDDNDELVNPDAAERCNGYDDNCNEQTDEGVLTTFYRDSDGDGFGTRNSSRPACEAPAGYVEDNTDCNDADRNINPDAADVCNGRDDNCNGQTDEGVLTTFYRDNDGDGYGNHDVSRMACAAPAGYVADDTDCNDLARDVNPGIPEFKTTLDNLIGCLSGVYEPQDERCALEKVDLNNDGLVDANDLNALLDDVDEHPNNYELCQGRDKNCDGLVNDGCECVEGEAQRCGTTDVGACQFGEQTCDQYGMWNQVPCVGSIEPQPEICDGIDNNCNNQTDEGVLTTFYLDADGDGYGTSNVNAFTSREACQTPAGFVRDHTDCDDNNAQRKPGLAEICDGLDNDCNGVVDNGVLTTFYRDADGDSFGDPNTPSQPSCRAPAGYVNNNTDCRDNDRNVNPNVREICDTIDNDCDTFIDEGGICRNCQNDRLEPNNSQQTATATQAGTLENLTICDDEDWYRINVPANAPLTARINFVHANGDVDMKLYNSAGAEIDSSTGASDSETVEYTPNSRQDLFVKVYGYRGSSNNYSLLISLIPCLQQVEVCDGIDNNCNGQTDEGVMTTFYRDADSDGSGDANNSRQACQAPAGYVNNQGDCDDNNAQRKPGLAERCDSIDNNCNNQVDEGVLITFYRDADGDGFGTPNTTRQGCQAPVGYVNNNGDCNDNNAAINPNAREVWDGIDNNCAGGIDEGLCRPATNERCGVTDTGPCQYGQRTCDNQSHWGNCVGNIDPVAERCDDIDNDCNGVVDNGVLTTFYRDADSDGFGTSNTTRQACQAPAGYVNNSGDCNDNDRNINPNAAEVCDGADNNCDFNVDEGNNIFYRDFDGDTFGDPNFNRSTICLSIPGLNANNGNDCNDNDININPNAQEICGDGIDSNCNGNADENCVCLDDLVEHNDSFETARSIQGNQGILSGGRLCPDDRDDYFKMSLLNGQALMIYARCENIYQNPRDCPRGFEGTFSWYNPNRNLVMEGPLPFNVDNANVNQEGWHYFKVHSSSNRGDGFGYSIGYQKLGGGNPCVDNDHDNYGINCAAGLDCNDNNASIHPGVAEVLNGLDDNCNGQIDEGFVNPGNPQITLMWNNAADLDLHVYAPDGCHLFYNGRNCGAGHLDRDARRACGAGQPAPPENIYWDIGQAPGGEYRVEVHYFQSCSGSGSTNYTVSVSQNGTATVYNGTVNNVNDRVTVTRFNVN